MRAIVKSTLSSLEALQPAKEAKLKPGRQIGQHALARPTVATSNSRLDVLSTMNPRNRPVASTEDARKPSVLSRMIPGASPPAHDRLAQSPFRLNGRLPGRGQFDHQDRARSETDQRQSMKEQQAQQKDMRLSQALEQLNTQLLQMEQKQADAVNDLMHNIAESIEKAAR
ncbi:hypothetical protein [Paraburkholderia humisilvae]|uniref:Uncharacterized protein n=1 Tax=Paraburkholderia humisilvae TaxID=627669 RepID=A0A6J5ECN5_9BURK|nr:hypothetical protein [Paraburkholderia humisilvae]CAB3764380.1 hypothetical protein LMG29542_04880 [Paraburkholderia humisilvae]